jgi:hypothetical protein
MKFNILRGAIAGALLTSASFGVFAAPLGEHVNGFYQTTGAVADRRGLGVQYLPTGNDQGVLFVAYYTYDEATGDPIWVVGNAPVTPADSSVSVDLFNVSGGNFGGDAGSPTENPSIGSGTLTFNSCSDISWSFSGSGATDFSDTLSNVNQAAGLAAPSSCSVYTESFTGCPSFATTGAEPGTCLIPAGEYTDDITLTNNTIWVLEGPVYIGTRATPGNPDPGNSNSITIEPGTRIIGGDGNTLLGIQPGAKIFANGTANAPIVFTGADGNSAGEWGGLTINGLAPLNTCDNPGQCTSEGEGESGTYGGDDPLDSSGVLRYVRVQYAGFRFNDTNELNGIAFQGVGSGTVVENVQVHANEDDGVEFFGGTVNARNLVLTDVIDDSVDWTEGWRGRLQNVLVVQNRDFDLVDVADRGIEADSLEGNNDAEPRAKPWIANATFAGRPDTTGATLRRGTGVNLSNVIFDGFDSCIDIDDAATFQASVDVPNSLTIQNSIVNCATNFVEEDGDLFTVESWFNEDGTNQEVDPALINGIFPPDGAAYLSGFPIDYGIFDSFFQNQDYIGAFGPGQAWTAGWTLQNFSN